MDDLHDLTGCRDATLLAFHRLREHPGSVRAIRDAHPVNTVEPSIIEKGTIVEARGLIVHGRKYLVGIPSRFGFYDYKDFEIIND